MHTGGLVWESVYSMSEECGDHEEDLKINLNMGYGVCCLL